MRCNEGCGCLNVLVMTPNISVFLGTFNVCYETLQIISGFFLFFFFFFLGLLIWHTLVPSNPVTPE